VGEAAHECLAVALLELVEAAAVDEAGDDLADLEAAPRVGRDDAVKAGLAIAFLRPGRGDRGRIGLPALPGRIRLAPAEVGHDLAPEGESVLVVEGVVIGHAGDTRVYLGPAELLGRDLLAGGRLHERRSAEEDRARVAHDHRLVAHGRHVRPAGRAAAHDERDLGDPPRRHDRLVVEDAAEVVAVGEDLVLQRQEGPAAVHEIEARKTVLQSDLLGAQVLLHGQRVVAPAFHGGVVGDDHALDTLDPPDPRHDPRRGRRVLVDAVRREQPDLEERAGRVEQELHALAHG